MNDTPAPRPDRTWLYVGLVFAAFWVAVLLWFNPMQPAGVGQPADFSWRLLDLDDRPVTFAQYKGKTVFLNIWATWCGPCVREMPSIAALASNPKLANVSFVCASTDDSAETVKRFLAGKDWPMTVLRATDLPPVFTTEGIPATFIIGPDGKVARSEIGSTNWNHPEVIGFLQRLASGG
jgi:thiol-disulfide isomerase/thioredoxin